MIALVDADAPAVEARRRQLLSDSDILLNEVEELRMAERGTVPKRLADAVLALQVRLGRADPPPAPMTVRAAHALVFAVQQRLMSANPRNPGPRPHAGRAAGQPVSEDVAAGRRWKFLALPPPASAPSTEAWLQLVDATVERACDRWAYAHHQAVRTAREGGRAAAALAIARAAWANYFELRLEADRLRLRLQAPPPEGRAARPR